MLPEVAVIFTAPLVMPLATPPALIETTPASDELHCTEAVKSVLLPSENVPNAENCCVDPGEIDAVPGEICNPVKVAGVGVGVGVGVGDGVGVGVGVGVGAGVGVGVGVGFGVGAGANAGVGDGVGVGDDCGAGREVPNVAPPPPPQPLKRARLNKTIAAEIVLSFTLVSAPGRAIRQKFVVQGEKGGVAQLLAMWPLFVYVLQDMYHMSYFSHVEYFCQWNSEGF